MDSAPDTGGGISKFTAPDSCAQKNQDIMDTVPKFQGTLEKQGRLKTWTWKKYWFVLKENQLTYVKSQDKMASQGHIDLCQAHSARIVTGNHGYPFEIVTKSRTHLLSASSPDVREKWLRVIHEAMAWSSRMSCRTGSINSTRASCNSLIDDEEEGYMTVTTNNGTNSPAASSGYSSSASDNRTSTDISASHRDSGTDDVMFFNTNYTKYNGSSPKAESIVRDSKMSMAEPVHYEDVDRNRVSTGQHKGLRRLHEMKTPRDSRDLPESLTARESDVSGIYDEVTEPMANIAISHIVKGYANIARNKGPQPEVPKMTDSDPYDEVFDAIPPQRESKVIMRRSIQPKPEIQSISDKSESNPDTEKSEIGRDSLPVYGSMALEASQQNQNTSPSSVLPRYSTPGEVCTKRQSRLPTDVEQYFEHDAIPDVPHPRMELTERSAFDDIREFLANNRGPNEVYTVVKNQVKDGKCVEDLKAFLTILSE